MKATTLSINGIGLTLRFQEASTADRVARRYGSFFTTPPTDLELLIYHSDNMIAREDRFEIRSFLEGDTLNLHASSTRCFFDPRKGQGELKIAPCAFGTEEIIENALRYIFQFLSVKHGGILVHASTVIDKERGLAFLFMGPEGAGKTTIAALSKHLGHKVINDDLIFLEPEGSKILAKSIPFYGDSSIADCNDKQAFRVGGIYSIVKSRQTRALKVPLAVGVAELLSNVPYTECYTIDLYQRILDSSFNIVTHCPVFELEFSIEGPIWEEIGRSAPRARS